MLNKVIITNITAAEAMGLKADLDQSGLVVNADYTWRFQPVKYNNDFSMYAVEDSQVLFEFADPAMASFYQLKWTR